MFRAIAISLICGSTLLNSALVSAHERGDRHRHDDRKHRNHHQHDHRARHQVRHSNRDHRRRDQRHDKHRDKRRRNNDAAVFIGGAIVGATLNSLHHNHHSHRDHVVRRESSHHHRSNREHRVRQSYRYERDRRGDCFKVEHRRHGREVWVSVPRRYCRSNYY